jgi:flagellin-like hook-associated protein FlgL
MIDMSNRMLYHINQLNNQSERISYQMASGKVLDKGSEDSLLHSEVINLEDKLRVTERLQLQITKTRVLNDTADTQVADTKEALESIKLDLMKALNDGMDRSDKLSLATNLKGIRERILDDLNTQIDGEYIFTGSDTVKQTMVKSDSFDNNGQIRFGGDAFLREVSVQPGSYRDRGVTAHDVIYYNTDISTDDDKISFTQREIVIDNDGHTWKAFPYNEFEWRLTKLDKNGDPTTEYMKIDNVAYDPQGFQVVEPVVAGAKYSIELAGSVSGDQGAIEYTALAGDTAEDIAAALATQINATAMGGSGDITATTSGGVIEYSLSGAETISFRLKTDNEDAVFEAPEPVFTTETVSEAYANNQIAGNTLSGFQLEVKHNYFDDLNVIINALEGYDTYAFETNEKLTGAKSDILTDAAVDKVLKNYLDITRQQYDATNIGHGELGGRNTVFEVADEKLQAQITHYNILLQETSGADLAKLAMESKNLEITYQSLYSTISKMNQLSLVKFMN